MCFCDKDVLYKGIWCTSTLNQDSNVLISPCQKKMTHKTHSSTHSIRCINFYIFQIPFRQGCKYSLRTHVSASYATRRRSGSGTEGLPLTWQGYRLSRSTEICKCCELEGFGANRGLKIEGGQAMAVFFFNRNPR